MESLFNFSWVSQPSAWVGLLTLVALEVVLGLDNIVFISILAGKLPKAQQPQARKMGLILAVVPRIVLLLALPFVLRLTQPVFYLPFADPSPPGAGHGGGAAEGAAQAIAHAAGAPLTADGKPRLGLSWQDIIVVIGGLFLLGKATHEIHGKLEGDEHLHVPGGGKHGDGDPAVGHPGQSAPSVQTDAATAINEAGRGHDAAATTAKTGGSGAYGSVLAQIMLLNIVFSIDSIVTAIGMIPPSQVMVMVLSVLIATGIMALAVNAVSAFVEKHPTVKMLALSFLLLIGTTLIIEGFHAHIPKGYVYFAMGFSVFVEMLNIKSRKGAPISPVALREPRA